MSAMSGGTGGSGGSSACSAVLIAVLLPDLLGTYSDAGNAVVLAERARRRGIPAEVRLVELADVPPRTADLYVIGGGEDTAQLAAAAWLARHRLRDELADRAVVLAVCAGFQLLGVSMTDRAGRTYPGAGVLDVVTVPGARRAVGEVVTTATVPGVGRLTVSRTTSAAPPSGPVCARSATSSAASGTVRPGGAAARTASSRPPEG